MNRQTVPALLAALLATAACGGDSETAQTEQTTTPPAAEAPVATAPMATDSAAAAPATPAPAPADGALLDPNTAPREALLTVPNMTPALADGLIQGRPYQDMRGVDQKLTGLSEEQRDQVYARLWKPIDPNTATAQEIELIPGVGPRMRHEFEEYRPWKSVEQFRREIGKYVNETEVARLERYVRIAG